MMARTVEARESPPSGIGSKQGAGADETVSTQFVTRLVEDSPIIGTPPRPRRPAIDDHHGRLSDATG